MSDPTTQGIRATFASLSDAWKKGDGAAFSECCTEDVDFINLLGMHVKGRRGVAELHEKIFEARTKTAPSNLRSRAFASSRQGHLSRSHHLDSTFPRDR